MTGDARTPNSARIRRARWLLAAVGVMLVIVLTLLLLPAREPRAAQSHAEQLAAAVTQYRQATGHWPESLEDLPAAAIRAANASVAADGRSRAWGGECDRDDECRPHRRVAGYRIDYLDGYIWPQARALESRTCADVIAPRLALVRNHGPNYSWNWERSNWQRKAYGERVPSFWSFAAVNDSVAWAVGEGGVYARTFDGGRTCSYSRLERESKRHLTIVAPVTPGVVYLLSTDEGLTPLERIYRTVDNGATLQLRHSMPDVEVMTLRFWDADHGLILGRTHSRDTEDYRRRVVSDRNWVMVMRTADGAATWQHAEYIPPLLRGETPTPHTLAIKGDRHAWFATYAEGDSTTRILRSSDRGRTWSVGLTSTEPALEIDGIAFRDTLHGVAIACGFVDNALMRTRDGGRSWTPSRRKHGWTTCSGLAYVTASEKSVLVVHAGGRIMYSRDDGEHWTPVDSTLYRGIAPTIPWRTWVEHQSGWANRWGADLARR